MSPSTDISLPEIEFAPGQCPSLTTPNSFKRQLLKLGVANFRAGKAIPKTKQKSRLQKKLTLNAGQIAQIDEFAEAEDINRSEAFYRLVMSGLESHVKDTQKKNLPTKSAQSLPFTPWCDEQESFWRLLQPAIHDQKIVMAEGSTGIGKGRALVAAAVAASRKNNGTVWIVSSTIALVGTLYDEFLALPEAFRLGIRGMILPGSREFVSLARLKDQIEGFREIAPEEAAKVDGWIRAGGPIANSTALSRALQGMGLDPCWLTSDLRNLCPAFPVDLVDLSSKAATEKLRDAKDLGRDPGQDLSDAFRKSARMDADIIFATHAMIGIASKSDWNFAPKPQFLIVDECHLFEQAIANISSKKLSFLSLRTDLREALSSIPGSKPLKEALQILGSLHALAQKLDAQSTDNSNQAKGVSLSGIDAKLQKGFVSEISALTLLLKSKTCRKVDKLGFYVGILDAVEKGFTDETAPSSVPKIRTTSLQISFSPDRRFPSILAGPKSVGGLIDRLWKFAEMGGIAASATIFVKKEDGSFHGQYIRRLLAIPQARLGNQNSAPVVAKHIHKIPILHIPSLSIQKSMVLNRPSSKRSSKEFAKTNIIWTNTCSSICAKIAGSAIGGTMVLCTSYKQIDDLTTALRIQIDPNRILRSERRLPFAQTESDFREKYKSGLRPVLVALGPAWTGVSLVDEAAKPAEDFLLTDLVITSMPVALNNTLSMVDRIEHAGMHPVIEEALMGLKQGLGRLIRRQGVTNRHLWVIDGRIWIPGDFGLPRLSAHARRMLKDYENTVEILKV